jgi:single-stranded DNA-specific DHH superfamily exonuclease
MHAIMNTLQTTLVSMITVFETKYHVDVDGESHARLKEATRLPAVPYCPKGTNHLLGSDAYRLLGELHYAVKGELLHVVGHYNELADVLAHRELFALAKAVGATTMIAGNITVNLSFGMVFWDQSLSCKVSVGCIHSALHM